MALYYKRNGHSDKLLNVGEREKIEEMNESADYVLNVQADGLELERIEVQFTDIPMCRYAYNRPVTWYGDHAKFIAKNFR